jgi:hypothetical protein
MCVCVLEIESDTAGRSAGDLQEGPVRDSIQSLLTPYTLLGELSCRSVWCLWCSCSHSGIEISSLLAWPTTSLRQNLTRDKIHLLCSVLCAPIQSESVEYSYVDHSVPVVGWSVASAVAWRGRCQLGPGLRVSGAERCHSRNSFHFCSSLAGSLRHGHHHD